MRERDIFPESRLRKLDMSSEVLGDQIPPSFSSRRPAPYGPGFSKKDDLGGVRSHSQIAKYKPRLKAWVH
jgi:hypothetical protein